MAARYPRLSDLEVTCAHSMHRAMRRAGLNAEVVGDDMTVRCGLLSVNMGEVTALAETYTPDRRDCQTSAYRQADYDGMHELMCAIVADAVKVLRVASAQPDNGAHPAHWDREIAALTIKE